MIRTFALVLLAGLAAPDRAAAQTFIWPGDQTGGSGGNGVSGNWGDSRWRLSTAPTVNHAPPTAADSVTALNGSSAFTLDVTDSRGITNVTFNNSNATLRILSGGSLAVGGNLTQSAGTVTLASGGTMTVAGFYTQNDPLAIDGSLTVNGAFTQGGNLSGTGSLTLNGAYNWNSGTISGNVVAANGGTLNGGTANLNIATGGLTYGGAVTWTGGNVTMANGTTFTLAAGAVMTHTTSLNSSIQVGSGVTTGAFVNNGTVVHKTTTNQSIIFGGNLLFTNTGTVRALSGINQTGTVSIQSVTTTTGVFDTGNSTDGQGIISLDGGGTTNFNSGSSVIGTGQFRVNDSHVVNLNAAIPASNLIVLGGTIQGNGSMTLSGALTWSNPGTLAGNATLTSPVGSTIAGTVTLGGGSTLNLNAPTSGTALHSWTSSVFHLSGTSVLNVGAGATLQTTASQTVFADGGTPTFNVAGTFRKTTDTSTTTIGSSGATLAVNNTGTISGESGTLAFTNVLFANTGTLNTVTPGVISFNAGATVNLNAGSVGTGTGTIQLNGSTAVMNVNADTTFTGFGITANKGTLQGTNTLTANGTLALASGTIGGTATLKATGGGSVGSPTVTTGFLDLVSGTYTWNGTPVLNGTGTLFRIESGATLSAAGNNAINSGGGAPVLQNDGILGKDAGTGTSTLGAGLTVNSTNLVRVQTGTLGLNGTLNNTGTISVASGAEVAFGGGTLNLNAGSGITGTGLLHLDSASATLNVNTTVSAATGFTFVRGNVAGNGTITFGGTFTFGLFSGSVGGTGGGTVTINAAGGGDWTSNGTKGISTGTVNLTGGTTTWNSADVQFSGSGGLGVQNGATLTLTDDSSLSRTAGSPTFAVNGLFQKTAGTGNSTLASGIAATIGTTGVVNVSSGNLIVQSAVANNGVLRASTGGTLSFNQAIALTGTGLIDVPGGTLTASNVTLSVPSTMSFTNAGTVQATSSGTLLIGGTGTNLTNFNAGTLTGGTWKATDGTINLNGRQITTLASTTTVELSGGGTMTGLNTLTQNNGQLRVYNGATANTGTVTNAGVIEASGTLNGSVTTVANGYLTGNGTVNGTVTMNTGGKLTPGPGPYAVPGTAKLTTGNVALNGGSTYAWEINSWVAAPTAGTHYDQIAGVAGAKLNLAGASGGNRVTLQITSLNGPFPGPLSNFDGSQSRSWVIADYSNSNASGGIQNFSTDKFTIDTSGFASEPNSTNFSLSLDANSNQIILTYTPIPEPAALLFVAASFLGARRLRRCKTP